MTYHEALFSIKNSFQTLFGDQALVEAERFFCEAVPVSWSELKLNPHRTLSNEAWRSIEPLLQRRQSGEPLAYIFENTEFFGSSFFVDSRVLIPRSETELLVELALEKIPQTKPLRIADLGCGSGCIGLSVAIKRRDCHVLLVDKSPGAIEVTEKNREVLGVESQTQTLSLEISESSTLSFLNSNTFDVILANPPYIPFGDSRVEASVKKFEPHMALFSPQEGLECIHKWAQWGYHNLNPGGLGFFEIGVGQLESVTEILKAQGFTSISFKEDYQGIPRVIWFRKE